MPSPTKTQLNISVDIELKEQFKALCLKEDTSLAKAFESFMRTCLATNDITSLSPSSDPNTQTTLTTLEGNVEQLMDLFQSVDEQLRQIDDRQQDMQTRLTNLEHQAEGLI